MIEAIKTPQWTYTYTKLLEGGNIPKSLKQNLSCCNCDLFPQDHC